MKTETELDRLFIQVLAETKGETFDRVKRIQAIVAAREKEGTIKAALQEVVDAHAENNPGAILCSCRQCQSIVQASAALAAAAPEGER